VLSIVEKKADTLLAISPCTISAQTVAKGPLSANSNDTSLHPMTTESSSMIVTVSEFGDISTAEFDEVRRTETVSFCSTILSSRMKILTHSTPLAPEKNREVEERAEKSTSAVRMEENLIA
jgi:hypothetical protein